MSDEKTAVNAGTAALGSPAAVARVTADEPLDLSDGMELKEPAAQPQAITRSEPIDISDGLEPKTPSTSTGGESGSWDAAPDNPVLGVLSGIGGAAIESVEGLKNIANKALPASAQIPDIPEKYRAERSTVESIGGGLENIAEFYLGDAALEGISKAAKLTALADKYPLV